MATNAQPTFSNWQLSRTTRVARHNPLAAIGVVLVAIFAFSAIFAPWIAPQDPAHIDLPNRLQSPSAQHWAGTCLLYTSHIVGVLYAKDLTRWTRLRLRFGLVAPPSADRVAQMLSLIHI